MAGPIQKTSLTIDNTTALGTCQLAGVVAGNSLAFVLSLGSGSAGAAGNAAPAVPTDTGDASGWLLAIGPVSVKGSAASTTQAAIYYKLNASAGTHALSQTLPAGSFGHWTFLEFPPASDLDLTTSNSGVTQVTGGNSGTTGVTNQASEAIIVALSIEAVSGNSNAAIADPATIGYTSLSVEQNTGSHEGAQHSYKEVGSAGTQVGSWTWVSGGEDVWMGVIATFKLNVPTINTQPSDQTVNNGDTATFTVSAIASAGSLSYQWQDNSGGVFANISGATSTSLVLASVTGSFNGRKYQVLVTDSNGTVTSNSVYLFVNNFSSRLLTPKYDYDNSEINFRALLNINSWFSNSLGESLQIEKWVDEALDAPSAAGIITITPTTGVYLLTGVNANLIRNRISSVAKGSYSLTGINVGLVRVYTILPTKGVYSLTGINANLIRNSVVGALKGTYTLTGINAGLLKNLLDTVAKGSYALTGINVGLFYDRVLAPVKGVYSLTGINVGLTHNSIYSVNKGTYLLTGQDIGLFLAKTISPSVGVYNLTGIASNLLYNRRLSISVGPYLLTGVSANLVRSLLGLESTGVYLLSGKNVNLLKSFLYSVSKGTYNLTGINVLLSKVGSGAALTGQYNLTGINANLFYDRDYRVNSGVHLLNGRTVNLIINRLVQTELGQYLLNGISVNLLINRSLIPQKGVYDLTGFSASFSKNQILTIAKGVYNLIGIDADLRYITSFIRSTERTYMVPAEVRSYSVGIEDRLFVATSEDRKFVLTAENRVGVERDSQ